MRQCGDCQLCCKLLPVRELGKGASERCRHQRYRQGCTVYGKPAMPPSCTMWNCRWLVEDRTENLRRPDRAGYVVDVMPDFVTVKDNETGAEMHIPVLQIWVDPARPEAWKNDPDLFAYVERLGQEDQMAALIRFNSEVATFVAPPAINPQGEWFIQASGVGGPTHTVDDFIKAGLDMKFIMEAPL